MSSTGKQSSSVKPSNNWFKLRQKLKSGSRAGLKEKSISAQRYKAEAPLPAVLNEAPRKSEPSRTDFPRGPEEPVPSTSAVKLDTMKADDSLEALRRMIQGECSESKKMKAAKKYIAIDCEMVGVGIDAQESSLARVSIVNYYGAVQMDEIVQQKERVVDYRTKWSGIRATDMVNAKPFEEVQKQVADMISGKILVGHAVHNDLKALLLSHPYLLTRDTQVLASKHKVVNNKYPSLRILVEKELGVAIQDGEHSSVIDARATMAIFRLHRKMFESALSKAFFVTALHKQPTPSNIVSKTAPEEPIQAIATKSKVALTLSDSEVEPKKPTKSKKSKAFRPSPPLEIKPKLEPPTTTTTPTGRKRKASSPPPADGGRAAPKKFHVSKDARTSRSKVSSKYKEQPTHYSATLVSGARLSALEIIASRANPSLSPAPKRYPGGGRKGVSSGLSTIIRRKQSAGWWKELKP